MTNCNFCNTRSGDDSFHPGTCGNCGAPRGDGVRLDNEYNSWNWSCMSDEQRDWWLAGRQGPPPGTAAHQFDKLEKAITELKAKTIEVAIKEASGVFSRLGKAFA